MTDTADTQPRSRSARDVLEAMIPTSPGSRTVWSPAEVLAALDAYRAEVERAAVVGALRSAADAMEAQRYEDGANLLHGMARAAEGGVGRD